jgi:mannose-6-phosphate isomerase-like protein (cupin superfamily)
MSSAAATPPGVRVEARRTIINKIVRDNAFFEKYSQETAGEYARVKVTVAPGGGTPLHYHRSYSESFFVVSGVLGVVCNSETLSLSAGESASVPIGALHRFLNPSATEDVTFIGEVRPGHEGFEKGLYILYGLANDGLCDEKGIPKNIVHLCMVAGMSDMYFPGFLARMGMPFIRLIAAFGRWWGEEEKLLNKYWN